jgi:DNA-binding MarR family transcriptional regulator
MTNLSVKLLPTSHEGALLARRPHLDLSDYLPYLINRVGAALVARFSEDALAGTRLSIATWRVLAALSNNGRLRQIDIAEITNIEVSTLSRLITRLVHMGLVSRTRSAMSNREVVVELTPKATALVAQLIPIADELQRTATQGLSKQDLIAVRRALRRMHENLTRSGIPE